MPANKKVADETREDVDGIYKRVFSCLHVVEASGNKCDPKIEIHQTSVMFSTILGHSFKEGLLDEKTLDELLLEIA